MNIQRPSTMWKLLLSLISIIAILYCSGQGNNPSVQKKPAYIANINFDGTKDVCPNSTNNEYHSSLTQIGGTGINFTIVYTCGGVGIITESNSQTYTITNNLGSSSSCHVNWENYNPSKSWVHVKISWTFLFVNYSREADVIVNIGAASTPSAINGPGSINIYDVTPFTAVCPYASLPSDATGYHWEVTGGNFGGSVTTRDIPGGVGHTILVYPNNSANPVTVKVCFFKDYCPLKVYGNPFTRTFPRSINAPLSISASGPSYCGINTTITLTCSAVPYVTSYVWTKPIGWTIVGNATGNSITVITDGTEGTVSVQAKFNLLISAATSLTLYTEADNSRHNMITLSNSDVIYVGKNQKLHRMYFNGTSWVYTALTVGSWPATLNVEGWLATSTNAAGVRRIYFKSTDNRLYNVISPNSSTWALQAIPIAGATVAGNIACRADGVFFINTSNKISRAYLTGSTWHCNELDPNGGYKGIPNGCLALAPAPALNIYYKTADNKLFNLWGGNYSISSLQCTEISTIGCTGEIITHPLTGDVYFKALGSQIHRLKYTTGIGWVETAITATNVGGYNVNGYLSLEASAGRIFYKAFDGTVHNIYPAGAGYLDYSLNQIDSGVAGDVIFFDNKVIYIGYDSRIRQYMWIGSAWNEGVMNPSALANVKSCSTQYDLLTK